MKSTKNNKRKSNAVIRPSLFLLCLALLSAQWLWGNSQSKDKPRDENPIGSIEHLLDKENSYRFLQNAQTDIVIDSAKKTQYLKEKAITRTRDGKLEYHHPNKNVQKQVHSSLVAPQTDPAQTATTIELGESVMGSIDNKDEVDWFTLTLEEETNVHIRSVGLADVVGRVLDEGEHELAYSDDDGESWNFSVHVRLSKGKYYILVSGFKGKAVGEYELNATDFGPDHGDIAEHATAIEVDGDSLEGIINPVGDIDYFIFEISEEQDIIIETSGDIDTYGTLYDESGSWLLSDDDEGAEYNFKLEENLGPGTYYVRVQGFADKYTGKYSLSVTSQSSSFNSNATIFWTTALAILSSTNPSEAQVNIDVNAFHNDSGENITFSDIVTDCIEIPVIVPPGYTGDIPTARLCLRRIDTQCQRIDEISEPSTYDAILLFDRSGSMAESDPNDYSIAGGRKFVENLSEYGKLLIADFWSSGFFILPSHNIRFLTPAFSNDKDELFEDLESVSAPGGGTPLWRAMHASIEQFNESSTNSTGDRKYLLVFSDGIDNQGGFTPQDIIRTANMNDVTVWAISLLNQNSHFLDSVAQATGGRATFLDNPAQLTNTYEFLQRIIDGDALVCDIQFVVSVDSTQSDEIGLGPGSDSETVVLTLSGSTGSIRRVLGNIRIQLPFQPGVLIGRSDAGKDIFATDLATPIPSCVNLDLIRRNICETPIAVSVCSNLSNTCETSLVQPDMHFHQVTHPVYINACLWQTTNDDTYLPVYANDSTTDGIQFVPLMEYPERTQDVRCVFSKRFDVHPEKASFSIVASSIERPSDTEGELSVEGELDWFEFSIEATTQVTVSTTGSTDTYGRLLDENAQVLRNNDDGGQNQNFRISTQLQPGTYYVVVSGFGTTVGSYTLSIE